MDLSSRLVNAFLCCVFLFGLLRWTNNMGLKSRLGVMQSHSKKAHQQQQRSSLTKQGLLCDGIRSILEDNFFTQKSRLSSSSCAVVQRTSVFARPSSSKLALRLHTGQHHRYDPLHISMSRLQDKGETEDAEQLPDTGIGALAMVMPYEALTPVAEAVNVTMPLHKSHGYEPAVVSAFTTLNERFKQPVAAVAADSINTWADALATRQELPVMGTHALATHGELSTTHEESLLHALDPYLKDPHAVSVIAKTGSTAITTPTLSDIPKEKEVPVYKKMLDRISSEDNFKIKPLQLRIEQEEILLSNLRLTREALFKKKTPAKEESVPSAGLTSLSEEEEDLVHQALFGANRNEVLVQHEPSNIDLTRAALQCLKSGVWLNDEVINLYLELLKERELREPKVYFKCHFFNTFFFNKLYKDARSYDFKAVKRWTTQRRLGYSLIECDKIFIPIHKDIHWCLAVINLRDKKLQYLDSLKGKDMNALRALARYIKDEARDKKNQDLDVDTWDLECPQDIPEQMNGCDCGMFMIKYADFLSRGDMLTFTQDHMEYFRRKTVLELLQLKAR